MGKKEELEKAGEEHKKALQIALNAAEKIRKQLNVNRERERARVSLYYAFVKTLPRFGWLGCRVQGAGGGEWGAGVWGLGFARRSRLR